MLHKMKEGIVNKNDETQIYCDKVCMENELEIEWTIPFQIGTASSSVYG